MASARPGPSNKPLTPLPITPGYDFTDLTNYESFMDSLINFMNESANTVQQVKQRSGIQPGCNAPVRMNVEEREQRMNEIITHLTESYRAETSQNDSSYRSALDSTPESEYLDAHNTAFSLPSPTQFRPRAASSPCSCPTASSQMMTPPSRSPLRRRMDTPRPGSPMRSRVDTPDSVFIPTTQSTMMSSGASRSGSPPARGRSQSPYSTLYDSGGIPDAYRSDLSPAFDFSSSQSGRNLSSYENDPSNSWNDCQECPRDCTASSINSTGRQQYRRLRGPQDNSAWRESNRTV